MIFLSDEVDEAGVLAPNSEVLFATQKIATCSSV
jgi:hypothetical protein